MPKISEECMFTAQGPKCCVSGTLEGSPCCRGSSCAICTGRVKRQFLGA